MKILLLTQGNEIVFMTYAEDFHSVLDVELKGSDFRFLVSKIMKR